jgi:predicted HD phosphohydrolase
MAFQGGIMSKTEAEEFESQIYFEESIKLRNWDDKAKITNIEVPSLEDCLEVVNKYLERRRIQL